MAAADDPTGSIGGLANPLSVQKRIGCSSAAARQQRIKPPKDMPESSRFSIQVQTAFEGVMGRIEYERDNDVYTGDKFLAPRTTYLPHSWKQERPSCDLNTGELYSRSEYK